MARDTELTTEAATSAGRREISAPATPQRHDPKNPASKDVFKTGGW